MSFYGFGVIRKSLVFTLLQSAHILSDFQVGNFSINLCRTNVAVSEHLTERLHCHTVGKADGRGESVASHVENIIHLRNWKNIENKPVTGCELVDFLYFTSVAEKQFGMEY